MKVGGAITEASLAGTGGGYALGQSFAERVFPSHGAGHTTPPLPNVELVFDHATGLCPDLAKRRSIPSAARVSCAYVRSG